MVLEHFILRPNDWVPNNPELPVLLYHQVREAGDPEAVASWFERTMTGNGWPAQWRDGIFDYHHYHSTAHEALGCAAGSAEVMLGGPGGKTVMISAGDLVVLPAGTGHCCISSTPDFMVVGAYPTGQQWDICKSAATPDMLARIASLPVPDDDPVEAASGPLPRLWRG